MTKTREGRCLYLSGPMSGLPENNYPAFHAAASALRAAGYRVVNPAELHPHGWYRRIMARVFSALMRRAHPAPSWSEYMRADLAALLRCHAIVTLPGWESSKGARCEVAIASELGMAQWSLSAAMGAQDDPVFCRNAALIAGSRCFPMIYERRKESDKIAHNALDSV